MTCRISGCPEPGTYLFSFTSGRNQNTAPITQNNGRLCERHSTLLHALLTDPAQLTDLQRLALELTAPMLASDNVTEVRISLGRPVMPNSDDWQAEAWRLFDSIPDRPTDMLPRTPTLVTPGHVQDHAVLNLYVREHPDQHELLDRRLRQLERRQRWLLALAVIKLVLIVLLYTVVR